MPQGNRRAGQRNRRDTKKTNKSESQCIPDILQRSKVIKLDGPLAVDVQTHSTYCPRLLLKKRCGGETVSEQTVLCYATVRSAFVFMAMQS